MILLCLPVLARGFGSIDVTRAVALLLVVIQAGAHECYVGRVLDPSTSRSRWMLPSSQEPCQCTDLLMGGVAVLNGLPPVSAVAFQSMPDLAELKKRYGCPVCPHGTPMGMEDGRIPDNRITASSYWRNAEDHSPKKARLNTKVAAAAWCAATEDTKPWIQVAFSSGVYITGLLTQARGEDRYSNEPQRVTSYEVQFSSDGKTWVNVTDPTPISGKMPTTNAMTFVGNVDEDRTMQVNVTFPTVLRAEYLRILPTKWSHHCSMRFEVLGCY